MMNDIAISVKNLTKVYHLYDKPQDRLKEALHPFKKKYHHDFYAMQDVSFEIKKGETVGIIGKNGAGKSTLLKMITGVLTPTSGEVEVNGKIASLLELGAGFNPEMTGIENIYLNGTIMGFTKEEMDSKVDAILEFADIGEFIHQPVKMYSSGMFARLAFSVAIAVEPDVLIVDEALSVGDMAFQMKCFKKFEDLQKQDKTILFVTHALDTIIRYCNRSIVIEQGKMIADTTPKDGVDIFKKVLTGNFQKQESDSLLNNENKSTILKDMIEINKDALEYGNGRVKIVDFAIIDEENKPNTVLEYNSEFTIYMRVKFFDEIKDPIFAFTIKDAKGLEITGTNSLIKHVVTGSYKDGDEVTVTFKQNANIQLGKYALSLGCVNLSDGDIEVYQRLYDVVFFDVVGSEQMVGFYDLGSDVVVSNSNK
jgi:teichoic acid transport system ATP-binding protein